MYVGSLTSGLSSAVDNFLSGLTNNQGLELSPALLHNINSSCLGDNTAGVTVNFNLDPVPLGSGSGSKLSALSIMQPAQQAKAKVEQFLSDSVSSFYKLLSVLDGKMKYHRFIKTCPKLLFCQCLH